MGKGTPAMGRRQTGTHIRCRRCGQHTYHAAKKHCASCGFGNSAKMRGYNWSTK